MILFILQNAYRSEKYKFRNEQEWYNDLSRSHTGRRLLSMIPDNQDVRVVNASPKIGNNVSSKFEPNIDHIKKCVEHYKPQVVCACGQMAQKGCEIAKIKYIPAPHPAWRALSKKQAGEIKKRLGDALGAAVLD
jgi:hypothetical protein